MLHLTAADLRARLPMAALVQALREAFISGCEVPLRHSHALGGAGTLLLMPAWPRAGSSGRHFGVKAVTIFPGNGALGLPGVHAVYALFDARTGVPVALLDGSELTARRTAAASALAASHLAREDATRLLLVGAGRVASQMAEAMRCVRPGLRQVQVWNRHPASAAALAATLGRQGLDATATPDLQAAVRQAHIVSCATLSSAALVQGEWLAPGAHLDLVGSFTPAMREADGHCFARGRVFVDTEEALAKSGDILQAVGEGHFDASRLQGTLAELCRGERPGRGSADEITLFKSVGSALEDLAAAELACAAPDNAAVPA
ncbi:MAG: ornithine cyclodeaminase family protein [Rubrivivax sp.]|nr:ornithine cyclodeaminase family protein [Rubrivivax sp.]